MASPKKEKEINFSSETEENIEDINKEYGEGTLTTLGKSKLSKEQKVLPTGSLILDKAIERGGYICGKIVEIFGLESSGKSTLALQAVRECQRLGKLAVYIDLENGLDIKYMRSIGVKDDLMIAYPDGGETTFGLINRLIKIKNVGLIVVDSVSNLIPRSQLTPDLEKHKIGSHALLMSWGLRNLKNWLINKEVVVIFINQIRNKISTGYYGGNPETTTGGMALRFDADLRIKLIKESKIEKNDEAVGINVRALVSKSKIGKPLKEANLEIIFGKGIQKEREIINLATELNVIQKSGTWYSYEEKKLGNGKENVVDYLIENPEVCQEIEKIVLAKLNQEI